MDCRMVNPAGNPTRTYTQTGAEGCGVSGAWFLDTCCESDRVPCLSLADAYD